MTSHHSFTLFSQLPTELRLKIWSLNLPGPRLIPIQYTSSSINPNSPRHLRGCTSPAVIPANLHVNREAREDTIARGYRLAFNLVHCPAKIWFNYEQDVCYFGEMDGYLGGFKNFVHSMMILDVRELRKVRRLGVCEKIFFDAEKVGNSVTDTCLVDFWDAVRSKFQAIEEVVFVPGIEGKLLLATVLERQAGVTSGVESPMDGSRNASRNPDAFYWIAVRALAAVEERYGWRAPAWRVVGLLESQRLGCMVGTGEEGVVQHNREIEASKVEKMGVKRGKFRVRVSEYECVDCWFRMAKFMLESAGGKGEWG